MNTKQKGDQTEAQILCRLVAQVDTVMIPFGENQAYDQVIDIEGSLYRIQCKTGRLNDRNSVQFNTGSVYKVNGKYAHVPSKGKCDFYGVYCPQVDEAWLVPSDRVGTVEGTINLGGRSQAKSNLSADFLIPVAIERLRSH